MPQLALVPPGTLRDRLNAQVMSGSKKATSRLPVLDDMAGTPPEPVGTCMALIDSGEVPIATVEITEVELVRFCDVGPDVSKAEGDWMVDPEEWRRAHWRYWGTCLPEIRAHLNDPSWELAHDMWVRVRHFRLLGPTGSAHTRIA